MTLKRRSNERDTAGPAPKIQKKIKKNKFKRLIPPEVSSGSDTEVESVESDFSEGKVAAFLDSDSMSLNLDSMDSLSLAPTGKSILVTA